MHLNNKNKIYLIEITELSRSGECKVYKSVGNVYMVPSEWDATFYSKFIGYGLNIFYIFWLL